MAHHHAVEVANTSGTLAFDYVGEQCRRLLQSDGAAFVAADADVPMALPAWPARVMTAPPPSVAPGLLSFANIELATDDALHVPPGYVATVLFAWGDPVSLGPAFKPDASNTAAEQAVQAGMHHDGMHYFPLGSTRHSSTHGLLAINHEYTDDGLLHPDGMENWNAEKVKKSQAAHGVSIVEVRLESAGWKVVRPSAYARRITAYTPIALSGPVAGSPYVKTAADPAGTHVLGTISNCAHGVTPWGTFLACEKNWHNYFVNPSKKPSVLEKRYGIDDKGAGYRWHEHDERFDVARHPNEPHRFGWIVEIDPYDSGKKPVKRTALGRIKHEGAATVLAADGRVVVYMGDDERFEYIYKFVSKHVCNPTDRAACARLLDEGTLYVARFNADGTGEWLALEHGRNGLTPANGFADQADLLVKTRLAADHVGATKMDRPEWITVNPRTREVYCTLAHNGQRGGAGRAAADAANPRADSPCGHIVRWVEKGGDNAALNFEWNPFVQCGDPDLGVAAKAGDSKGPARKYACPDGLWFDERGVLWIQTGIPTSVLSRGDYARIGNNQMLAADPATGETRRFLTGPRGCEVTGVTSTPDQRTLFVNIQHPGEIAAARSDPDKPKLVSSWPDGPAGGRPRSATVAIQRADGGIIGT